MILLGFLLHTKQDHHFLHSLFHNFHYLHLVFAGTGTVLIFRKYSKSLLWAVVAGFIIPAIFCTLSDSILPYLGGWYLSLDMRFHWCFIEHLDKVLPFLTIGVLNGFVMSSHGKASQFLYSTGSHFAHILISSMASILYLASFGFSDFHQSIGFVFLYLIGCVLIPCSLADLVVPMMFARKVNKRRTKK